MKNDTHANDNEPNPWSSIGLQAAMIVNKLQSSRGEIIPFENAEISVAIDMELAVGRPRLFGSVKNSEEKALGIDIHSGVVSDRPPPRYDPRISSIIYVGEVLLGSCCAKIMKRIVRSIAIDMIDQVARPGAMDVKPSKAMREIIFPKKLYAPIASIGDIASNLSQNNTLRSRHSPMKLSAFRSVMQQVSKRLDIDEIGHQLSNSEEENRDVVKRDKQPSDSENEQREEIERADIQRRMRDILHMENTLRRKSRK